ADDQHEETVRRTILWKAAFDSHAVGDVLDGIIGGRLVGDAAVPGRASPLFGIAAQRPRYWIVDLHVQLRIVFDRFAALRIETLGPVQIVDVLSALDELSVRSIQGIEEPVAAEVSNDLAELAPDHRVIEHMHSNLVVVPRIVRSVLKMPGQFAGIDVEGYGRIRIEVVTGTRLRIVLRNRIPRAPDA